MSDHDQRSPHGWRPPQVEGPLKTVLVAEDDYSTQNLCRMGLRGLAGFKILVASNGLEALEIIKNETINVLVTDLNMPVLDGFALIAAVSKQYPHIPILVMTSLNQNEHGNLPLQLGALQIFPKPIRLSSLMEAIKSVVNKGPDGMIRGLTLNSLLQLMEWERKNATIVVSVQDETGYLYVKDGLLIHAMIRDQQGVEAAYRILGWDSPAIEFTNQCRVSRTIDLPLTEVLLNAAVAKDTVSLQLPNPEEPWKL